MTPDRIPSWPRRVAAWLWLRSRIYDESDPRAGVFRAQQLESVIRLMPIVVLANLVSAVFIVLTFWTLAPQPFLLIWLGVVAVIAVNGLPTYYRWRMGRLPSSVSIRVERRAIFHAAMLGTVWGFTHAYLMAYADPHAQLVAMLVNCGMLASGSFALGVMPRAGTLYVSLLAGGGALGLAEADMAVQATIWVMLVLFTAISLIAVWTAGRFFGERLMAQAEAEHQAELVGLLLRDFEENASDVLWEIDAKGRLRSSPERLAALLGLNVQELAEQPLLRLLALRMRVRLQGRQERLRALRVAVAAERPFRDLLLAVGDAAGVRWISVTAKPLHGGNGQRAGWRGVISDITDSHRASEQIAHMAHHDVLTGLVNRHRFRTIAGQALHAEDGQARPAVVVCLDLDHFKTTNDTLGHAAGDAMLVEVAKRLQSCTRRGDLIARLGGDEFAALFMGVDSRAGADMLARRLLATLQQPLSYQGMRVPVRMSLGLALAPQDGEEIDALLNHADLALNNAKTAGRATWRYFEPRIAEQTRRRTQLEEALRGAIRARQLWLAFQPKVNLTTGQVVGFEALLRWTHPEFGPISPVEFIPIAESSGLIVPIGDWVLQEALRAASQWPNELSVAVNVSPHQAGSADYVQSVQQALARHDMEPRRLELEITESIFINEGEAATEVLTRLREAGVRIALDDFGTSYSSLAYLRQFPFDTLKIDRSFMRELLTRADARAIVDTIVALAHTLKMATVAEGVEEFEQVGALREHGCQLGQGFWIAKPMPGAEVPAFLDGWRHSAPGRALLPPQQGLTLVA